MKLIALIATAVTARRVDTPAPGFINEQGGYWADQSRDQSEQRPQPPQPPHTQPRPDTHQCCRDIKFTGIGGDVTWLKHHGNQFDDMPVYEMIWNDLKSFMWWQHDNVPDNRPQKAVPGRWVISAEVGNDEGVSGNSNYRRCPDAEGTGFPEGVTFECATPPPRIESCIETNSRQNDIFLKRGDNFADTMVCRVAPLMRQLVGNQFQQLLATQDPSIYGPLNDAFHGMINGWESMAKGQGQGQCGFRQSTLSMVSKWEYFGVVNNCGTACLAIKEINEPRDFNEILGVFALYVVDNFTNIGTVLNEEPNERSKCGRKLSKLLRNIAKFEDIVGNINGLPSYGKWRLE